MPQERYNAALPTLDRVSTVGVPALWLPTRRQEPSQEHRPEPASPRQAAYHIIIQPNGCRAARVSHLGSTLCATSDKAHYVALGRARIMSPLVPLRFSPPVHALRPRRLASLFCYGAVQDKPRQRFVYLSVHLKRPCGVDGIP